ncbi:unnamed protein product [Nyctereutes procyonoides]|uniref:(raccoon dog) hypothetical protein n=1 Tax=Nyctereutes procyonoides TaxID=34880 RepID=A0A811YJX8_NYCPR|nr:unnamed protein product [Nyctereutes procyonoides]
MWFEMLPGIDVMAMRLLIPSIATEKRFANYSCQWSLMENGAGLENIDQRSIFLIDEK